MASTEGNHVPEDVVAPAPQPGAAEAMTTEQRVANFKKNLYPSWEIQIGSSEEELIKKIAEFFYTTTVEQGLLSDFKSKFGNPQYAALGGGTPLHWAVRMEDVTTVARILKAVDQVDVNAKDEWWEATALHWAVRIGTMVIVDAMVTAPSASSKFNLRVRDRWGYCALDCALLSGKSVNIPMLREVLKLKGPKKDYVRNSKEGNIWSKVEEILNGDGSPDVQSLDSQRKIGYEELGYPDSWGGTVTWLYWAVRMDDKALALHILADPEVDVNAKDLYTISSALWLAVTLRNFKMAQTIFYDGLSNNKSKSEDWYRKLGIGATHLHWAVEIGAEELLFDVYYIFRININAQDELGRTPLHLAVERGSVDMVTAMVDTEAFLDINANILDKQGWTPLHYAVIYANEGTSDMVTKLLTCKGIRLTEKSEKGPTALEIAHEVGNKVIENILMNVPEVRQYVEDLYRDRQVYVDAANAILVGAALIASVTFASWLQPPLGYGSLGYADVEHNRELRAFWVFNCLSFYFAIATVVFGARSVLPRNSYFIKQSVEKLRKNLLVTSILLACAVFFVIIAFGIAGCIVLNPVFTFRLYMVVPTILGGLVCMVSIALLGSSIWENTYDNAVNQKGKQKLRSLMTTTEEIGKVAP